MYLGSTLVETSTLEPGASVDGRYRIVRLIDKGAMGAVYEAFDARLQARRAVKVMLPELVLDDDLRARFQREAHALASIDHPNVLRLFDAGVFAGMPYLVMEMLVGETLEARLERRGAFAPSEVLAALRPVAEALDFVASLHIIHRDVKPANIFVARRSDGSEQIKLLDFGAAKRVLAPRKATTVALGTPYYMAPEQLLGDGDIGPGADRYALAQVAFTLLAGAPYWMEEARVPNMMQFVASVVAGPREAPSHRAMKRARPARVPPAFDLWFARATAADPGARFASAGQSVEALARALEAEAPPPRPRAAVRPLLALGGSALIGLAVTLALVAAMRRPARRAPRPPPNPSARLSEAIAPASSPSAPSTLLCMAGCACVPPPYEDLAATPVASLERYGKEAFAEQLKERALVNIIVSLAAQGGRRPVAAMVALIFRAKRRDSAEDLHLRFTPTSMSACPIRMSDLPFVSDPPRCAFERALSAAIEAGLPSSASPSGSYFAFMGQPVWAFNASVPSPTIYVGEDCRARTGL